MQISSMPNISYTERLTSQYRSGGTDAVNSKVVLAESVTMPSGITSGASAASSTSVRISQAGQAALSASQSSTASVDARLAEIQRKGLVNRSAEDTEYLWKNEPGLAAIQEKQKANPNYSPTAAELDHMQKATGFVNTMANLSPAEKDLYDKAIASGNQEAAAGIGQIALIRMMGHMAGGAPGTTYDPLNTAITPENIKRYFSYSIVDPSGKAQEQFQALIQFLQNTHADA